MLSSTTHTASPEKVQVSHVTSTAGGTQQTRAVIHIGVHARGLTTARLSPHYRLAGVPGALRMRTVTSVAIVLLAPASFQPVHHDPGVGHVQL